MAITSDRFSILMPIFFFSSPLNGFFYADKTIISATHFIREGENYVMEKS